MCDVRITLNRGAGKVATYSCHFKQLIFCSKTFRMLVCTILKQMERKREKVPFVSGTILFVFDICHWDMLKALTHILK
jgi:hypothetical protein